MDIRSRQNVLKIPPINFSFKIVKDPYGSFDVLLFWDFDSEKYEDIKEFKIYKGVLPKPRLEKTYTIKQDGLEKLTANKNLFANANILYNKSLISQNSKVQVENSNSKQHQKDESQNFYSFFNLSRVKANKKDKSYRFLDKNVKFGETYNYYITAITKKHQETKPLPVLVNLEWPSAPSEPEIFNVSELVDGILITVGNNQDFFISKFVILRREDSDSQFIKLAELNNSSEVMNYVDKKCLPKKNYIYRAYSVDIFGNVSATSKQGTAVFRSNPVTTNIEYRPSFKISDINSSHFLIELFNNRPDKIKCVKIERRDDWKYDSRFEVKKYEDIPWPASLYFDSSNKIYFEDRNSKPNKKYSYRITSYNEKNQPVSYITTPVITVGERYSDINIQLPSNKNPEFKEFNLNVLSENQDPVSLKLNWAIDGDWSHLILKFEDQKIKIDNVHSSIILNVLKRSKLYNLSVELYDISEFKVYEMTNLIVKT